LIAAFFPRFVRDRQGVAIKFWLESQSRKHPYKRGNQYRRHAATDP
jgi:hypothetical protein